MTLGFKGLNWDRLLPLKENLHWAQNGVGNGALSKPGLRHPRTKAPLKSMTFWRYTNQIIIIIIIIKKREREKESFHEI